MIGNFSSFNFSESLQQIMTQVRAVLLPELQKIDTIVQASSDNIDKVVERIGIIERRMDVIDGKINIFALGKNLDERIDAFVSDAKSTTTPSLNTQR